MDGWAIFRAQWTSSPKLLDKYYQNFIKYHDFAIIFNTVDENNNVDKNNNIDHNWRNHLISWHSWIIMSLKISCWIKQSYIHITVSPVLTKISCWIKQSYIHITVSLILTKISCWIKQSYIHITASIVDPHELSWG